ncbi:MAG TPA: DUF1501 domain-containing protein [Pirellulales bacterium]|jgi:hypothetical protein|nr:DUF1501 domain-containing protein [Pirellulales bacterium]
MDPRHAILQRARRNFLATCSSGIGGLALASLLKDDGLLAAEATTPAAALGDNSLAPRPPHFAPKAKACIFIFLEGAPSQLDLFDPKPKLNELNGQALPESMTKNVRFAFIQKETAVLLGSPRKFQKYGDGDADVSDLLPNIATCANDIALIRSMHTEAFNHHPGQLMMNTGVPMFGRPSMGSWLNYGLGSASNSLPGYVVLTAGRGTSGGASLWSSGFLPSTYQGVLFRNTGEPVLNLNNPAGVSQAVQRNSLDALERLNHEHLDDLADPEIASRISAYELAFRMQSAAPELIDLGSETQATRDAYGVERGDDESKGFKRGGQPGVYAGFAKNCLLARRLVERGVRFVNLYHASWDHHSNLDAELKFNCGMADQPVAALIKDLKQRGLLDTTLVVWAGEFGRTPLGENRKGYAKVTGRDHHPFAFSLWMAGGGIRGGQVIGKTDDIGWNIVEDPIHINDLHATMLHLFGLDHLKLTYKFQGRNFRLTDVAGKVVNRLIA